jgi:hypothetical protein
LPAFVVNRNAGRFARRPTGPRLVRKVVSIVGSRGEVFPTSSAEELDAAARRIVETAASPVVLCGGDGTYLAGVTALHRAANGAALPPLVLVRGGTVSIAARNWSRRSGVVSTVRRVVHDGASLRFEHRPTLAVSDGNGVRIGCTFGTGLVAKFFTEYEKAGAGGNLVALGIAARTFVDSIRGGGYADRILTPLECRITIGERVLEPTAFSLVVASVLRDVGLHLLVNHRAGEDPARPHLVASPLSPRLLGPQWPRVFLGRPLLGAGNFDGLVESFRVDFPDDRGAYVLDGDTFHARSVTVRAGPMIRVAR